MTQNSLLIVITLKESLDERWANWFTGLNLSGGKHGPAVLSGAVADRAALHGILEQIRDLNLSLVSVQVKESSSKGNERS